MQMKNALVLSSTFLPAVGGIERYMYEVTRRLPTESMTICASRAEDDEAFDAKAELPIIRMPRDAFSSYWNERRRRAFNLARLSRLCLLGKTQVVIASRAMPDGLIAWMLREVWGIPYVVYTWALDILRRARGEWGRRYVTRVLRGAEHVVGCSEFTCSTARKLGIEASKVTKIYPGVNLDAFRRLCEARFWL